MRVVVKDCPFCGAGMDNSDVLATESGLGGLSGEWSVHCMFCGAEGGRGDSKAEARKNWNKRTIRA